MTRSQSGLPMPAHAAANNNGARLHNRRRSALDATYSEDSLIFNESDASPRGAFNTERNRATQRSPTNQDIRELDDLKIRDLSSFSRVSGQAPRVNQIFPRLEGEADDISPVRQRTVSEPNVASEEDDQDQDQSSPKAHSERSQSNSDMKR